VTYEFEERARELSDVDTTVTKLAAFGRAEHIRALEWIVADCGDMVTFPLRRAVEQRLSELKAEDTR
jgi:hypothetical protein